MEIIAFAQNYLVTFIVMLSVLVFVHEYGHFWVARKCGVKVEEFSIGFGKELFGWNDKFGTRWKFCLLPLGGFVKMYGDADESSATSATAVVTMTEEQKKQAFFAKPLGQRAAIVFAGPAANYIFAILILTGLFIFYGQPYTAPEVGDFAPNSPAAAAGIQKNDKIISIDGVQVERFEEIQRAVAMNTGSVIQFEVMRDGQSLTIPVQPNMQEMTDNFGNKHTKAVVGISKSGTEFKKHGVIEATKTAFVETYNITVNNLRGVGQMVMGTRSTDELGGPLRIAKMTGEMAQNGFVSIIWFAAMLSISLGLINLFPIPVLDGGHLFFYFFEAILGKPLPERVQEYGFKFGLALILSLMLFSTWNDLEQMRVFSYVKELFL